MTVRITLTDAEARVLDLMVGNSSECDEDLEVLVGARYLRTARRALEKWDQAVRPVYQRARLDLNRPRRHDDETEST